MGSPLQRALGHLKALEEILVLEGEDNWLRGIRATIIAGSSPAEDAFLQMRSRYRSMYGGSGGFGDYFIWRESSQARIDANAKLDRIRSQLWDLLG